MIGETGFEYEFGTTEYDAPMLMIDGSDEGAKSVEILFNDCDDESSCTDMQMRITVATPKPVPLSALNAWNKENRLTRAYWDASQKVAVLEMDLNAYGGVGENNVQYTLHLFLANISMFAEAMKEAVPSK